ncbi:MAG: M48 family metalloprotease, partial [bacterium]|nr:M48 family metalloprotease [bacterium]
MTDLLLQFGISNLGISGAIAVAAWAVHATGKRPLISHLLWLLVLAKLVTPPILTVPVVAVPGQNTTAIAAADWNDRGATAIRGTETTSTAAFGSLEDVKLGLVLLWLLGSACVLAWSLVRIYRFNRLLGMASGVAPPEVQRVASEIAQRLGLKSMPAIHTTSAQLSPMVWWVGGQVRVVIPGALIEELESEEIRSILARELAHVRRRDHLVRWLEWLASVCFWWKPVAWWARRSPRINEEICCDAL